MKTVKALVGRQRAQERALLRRERHARRDAARHRHAGALPQGRRTAQGRGCAARGRRGAGGNVKILTTCPSCLQGLSRYGDDLKNGLLEADYIVVEMARQILGEDWMPRLRGRGQRRRHRTGAGLSAARLHWHATSRQPMNAAASTPTTDRADGAQAVARARGGLRRRRELPHSVRADARLFAVGRGAGPRPGPGSAADRQARGRHRRARAGRPLRGAAALLRRPRHRHLLLGLPVPPGLASRTSCGAGTSSAWPRPASTATRRCAGQAAGARPAAAAATVHGTRPP